jgi:exonuclease SbcC
VESLPKARGARTLEKAKAALSKAEASAALASDALREAQSARDAAERDGQDAAREAGRIEKARAKLRRDVAEIQTQLAAAFGGRAPTDPIASVDERLERLERLEADARDATAEAALAKDAAVSAERARDALLASVAEARARLEGMAVDGLLGRARSVGGKGLELPALPSVVALKDDADAVGAAAAALADGIERLAGDLRELADRRAAGEAELLAEARDAIGDLIEPPGSLSELVSVFADARRSAAAERAAAEKDAARLRERLLNAGKLVEEIAAERRRAERFDALAKELRADRIIAFLQLEALQILAAAGSEHLSTLSGGRYGLRFDEDEFFVVDTWNGEESRSARTLSGGETFLASLGLALALSEQVRSLSVSEKARLDSLFLDEGFGTLDPETLEVVVEAIEQLGGDGRMVGVITHVQELAIRLPARIDVEKSPRGSRLEIVT